MLITAIEAGAVAACVGGAVLAELVKPAEAWKTSIVNICLGMFCGTFGPQGLEILFERLERAHKLVIAVCSLSGAIVIRSFLDWLRVKKFAELASFVLRILDAARRKPDTPAGGT